MRVLLQDEVDELHETVVEILQALSKLKLAEQIGTMTAMSSERMLGS